jgi:hypothetical protein
LRFSNVLQSHDDICVLINRSGYYRLERRYAAKQEVFVGSLSASDLQEFEQILNTPELHQISRDEVPRPMIIDTIDHLLIDVYRKDGEQHLEFNSPDARKRFRSAVDPLIKWLDRVQDMEHSQLDGSIASHCMPPSSPQLSTEQSAGRPINATFLMMLARDHYRGSVVEHTCTLVNSDGRYLKEKSIQEYQSGARVQRSEGTLSATQIGELRALLDEPKLKNMKHDTFQNAYVQEGEITLITIPRQTSVQSLRFAHYFQVLGDLSKPGGMSGLQYGLDPDERTLDPIRSWLKKIIDGQKVTLLPHTAPSFCRP